MTLRFESFHSSRVLQNISKYWSYITVGTLIFGLLLLLYGVNSLISEQKTIEKRTAQHTQPTQPTADANSEEAAQSLFSQHPEQHPESTASAHLQVYVSGAVKNPGVYALSDESRVKDAIELAGGFTKNADGGRIARELNLAEKVHDEDHVHVAEQGSDISQPTTGGIADKQSRIDVNSATTAQLQSLTGVGEVTATKIMQLRPFLSFQDFSERTKISAKVLDQIRDEIVFYTPR